VAIFFLPLTCLNASSHAGFDFVNSVHLILYCLQDFESKGMFFKLFATVLQFAAIQSLPEYYYFSDNGELRTHTNTVCADGLS